jgi:peptidoglycan-associated lipoprotein
MAKSKLIHIAAITFAVFLAGCASNDVEETSGSETTETGMEDEGMGDLNLEVEQQEPVTMDTSEEDDMMAAEVTSEFMDLLDQTLVYFDFDESSIRSEFRTVLNAHSMNLAANPNMTVVLEGHADERGTREYNLALGERRAKAVERFLIVNGASRGQIETVSYGEEKPAVRGSSESAWAQNRRVELIFD